MTASSGLGAFLCLRRVARADLEPIACGLHVVEDDVARDRDEPGPDIAPLVGDRGDPAQGPQEGLAGEVLGQRAIVHAVVDEAVDRVDVAVVQLAECPPSPC